MTCTAQSYSSVDLALESRPVLPSQFSSLARGLFQFAHRTVSSLHKLPQSGGGEKTCICTSSTPFLKPSPKLILSGKAQAVGSLHWERQEKGGKLPNPSASSSFSKGIRQHVSPNGDNATLRLGIFDASVRLVLLCQKLRHQSIFPHMCTKGLHPHYNICALLLGHLPVSRDHGKKSYGPPWYGRRKAPT